MKLGNSKSKYPQNPWLLFVKPIDKDIKDIQKFKLLRASLEPKPS